MGHTCKSSFRRLKQDWEFKTVGAASEALFHINKRRMRIMRRRRGKGRKGRRRGEEEGEKWGGEGAREGGDG